ncbi:MAG TPA: SPOR domain-containing protein [Anaeromyxobacteraceae bacterium]|nr:SPOR domain-containing protein [Anaeromyxobacteraceae bacterium]
MRENVRTGKDRFELSLDAKQAVAVLVASLAVVAGVFVLGMSAGRAAAVRAPAPAASKDPLARLDEPIAAKEEPPPELKAHEALTADKPIDKALPVQPARAEVRDEAGGSAVEVTAPPQIPRDATAASAQRVATTSTPSSNSTPISSPVANEVVRPEPFGSGLASVRPERSEAKSKGEAYAQDRLRDATASRSRRAPNRVLTRISAPPASPHHGAYTIQVASSQRRADAERAARKLSSRGARVVAADVPGKGRWYRVQLGEYPSRDAAARQLASLSRAGVQGVVTPAAR